MESRRNYYRHHFGPGRGLRAVLEPLTRRPTFEAEITNMSLGGMRIRIEGPSSPFRPHDRFHVQLTLPRAQSALSLHAVVVYVESSEGETRAGMHCLPAINRAADEALQTRLWRFLLDEQRQAARSRREGDEVSATGA